MTEPLKRHRFNEEQEVDTFLPKELGEYDFYLCSEVDSHVSALEAEVERLNRDVKILELADEAQQKRIDSAEFVRDALKEAIGRVKQNFDLFVVGLQRGVAIDELTNLIQIMNTLPPSPESQKGETHENECEKCGDFGGNYPDEDQPCSACGKMMESRQTQKAAPPPPKDTKNPATEVKTLDLSQKKGETK